MKSAPFDYHAPSTVDETVRLLAGLGDAKVIAGGQSFVPLMALRLATFEHLVDLRRVEGIRGIEDRGDHVWVGAATTQATAEHDAIIAAKVPMLAQALPLIGHFQIRNRGTIGGSLAHADPAAELPAVAAALDATFEATGPNGQREIPAADFFDATFTTALDEGELLTGIRFPIWAGRCGFAVEEVARRHGDFAIAGAAVGVQLDDSGAIERCAIGLFGLGSIPERARAVERTVIGSAAADVDTAELGRLAVDDLGSIPSDLNGSAAYRARIGAVVVSRAVTRTITIAHDRARTEAPRG